MIYPFKNTGNKKFSYYSEGITESVINDLGMLRGVGVISQEDRKKALKDLAFRQSMGLEEVDISKVAIFTGADMYLTGSYSVEGDMIRIIARLIDTSTGIVKKSIKIDGLTKNIFNLQDTIVTNLLNSEEKVNEGVIDFFKNKPVYSGTAYEYFSKGLEIEDSNPKEALDLYKKSLNIESDYVDVLNRAGIVALILNNTSESSFYFEKIKSLEMSGGKKNKFNIDYNRIGVLYYSKGQYDKALDSFSSQKKILESKKLMNSIDYANVHSNIGQVLYFRGEYDKALEQINKSLKIREKLGKETTPMNAVSLNILGNIYKSFKKYDKALENYNKSERIWENLGLQNSSGYATTLGNLGIIYNSKGNMEKSLEYYNKAQTLRVKLGLQNTSGFATTLGNIGNLYSSQNNFEKALEYYKKSQDIRDLLKLQNTPGYATTLNNIGSILNLKGDYLKASELFLKAQAIRESIGLQNTPDYAISLYNLGVAYENLGKEEKAKEFFQRAKEIRDKNGITDVDKNPIDKIE